MVETSTNTFSLSELHAGADCDCIEIVKVNNPTGKGAMCLVVDDVGRLVNKRAKLRATLIYGCLYDGIVGDCIICTEGIVDGEHDLVKFTSEEAKELMELINGDFETFYNKLLEVNQ